MREFVKKNRKKIIYGLLTFLVSASVLGSLFETVNADHASNHCPPGYTYRVVDNKDGCTADSDIFQVLHTVEKAWEAHNRGNALIQKAAYIPKTIVSITIDGALKVIAFILLKVTGVILWMAGTMFNAAISISIIHMKSFVDGTTVINEAWTVIRDLVNMAFIFVLLYIAISTILGMGKDTKKALVGLIIAALLINFSLFFTKIVIDASNIVALQFYSAIIGADEIANQRGENDLGDKIKRGTDRGLSNVFSQAVGISGTFNPQASANSIQANQFHEGFDASKLTDSNNFATIGIIGSLFLLIMAFVFFVGAFLFITRFVILILLMVASPIAFVGLMLPQFKKAGSKWWKTLLDQAFFAPAFMILMYLVALIVTSEGFKQMSAGENLSNAFIGQGSIVIVLNFVIVIVLALAAITISKSMMGGVSSGAVNWATKAGGKLSFGVAGAIGRQTVGRAAYATTQSTGFQKFSRTIPLGRHLYSGVKGISGASFDARSTGLTAKADAGTAFKGGFLKGVENAAKKRTQFDKDTEEGREALEKVATKTERDATERASHAYQANVDARKDFENNVITPLQDEVARLEHEATVKQASLIATDAEKDQAQRAADNAKQRLEIEKKVLAVKKQAEVTTGRENEQAKAGLANAIKNYRDNNLDPYYRRLASPTPFTPGWWAKPGRIQGQPTKWESSVLNFFEPLASRGDKKALADIRKRRNKSKLERALDDIKESVGQEEEKKKEPEKEEPDGS
jgi:hypothetical protein